MTDTHRYLALSFEVLIKNVLQKQSSVPTMRVVSKYPVTPVPYPRGSPDLCLSETHIWGHCALAQWIRPYALRFLYTVVRTSHHRFRLALWCVIHYFVLKLVSFIN